MMIPRENVVAAFPSSVKVGNITLMPLTLGGVIRLAAEGIDLSHRVDRESLFKAAYILSRPASEASSEGYRLFLKHLRVGLDQLSSGMESLLNEAFETYIKPSKEQNSRAPQHLTPHGLGWPLEYAEWLMSEYAISFEEALNMPLARVYALEAAARQRNGGKHAGLDYLELQYRRDLKAGKAQPVRLDKGKEEAV